MRTIERTPINDLPLFRAAFERELVVREEAVVQAERYDAETVVMAALGRIHQRLEEASAAWELYPGERPSGADDALGRMADRGRWILKAWAGCSGECPRTKECEGGCRAVDQDRAVSLAYQALCWDR